MCASARVCECSCVHVYQVQKKEPLLPLVSDLFALNNQICRTKLAGAGVLHYNFFYTCTLKVTTTATLEID